MKYSTPRGFALLVSVWLAVAAAVVVIFSALLTSQVINWLYPVLAFTLTFPLSYFILLYAVEKFISKRIRVIYKMITSQKLKPGEKPPSFDLDRDIIGAVNKQVEQLTTEQQTELEQLRRMELYRKEFVGNVSHELKTPIFNIQGYVLTLLDGGLEDPTINRNYLQRAEASVERMINIVQDLESISQFESGQLVLDVDRYNIVKLADDAIHSLEFKARKKGIKLIIKDNPEPFFALCDNDRIKQVYINLLENSIKYGKANGRTKISFFDLDESILIEVTDDGIGIDEKHLSRLFERFYRVDKSRSREAGGTGLGLSIVKHIIEAHGQTITVRSTPGVGTTFAFTLKKAQ